MFARRPPALGPRCAPGRAGRAGRAGRGAAPGRGRDGAGGARQPARTRPARPHKAGRAEQGRAGSRPPAPGRRARVCAGPGRARDTKGNGRAGAAGGEPRPHRRDPRPPSGLYVSAPGGAASARRPGPPLPPREGGPGTAGRRRAGGPAGEKVGRGTPLGEKPAVPNRILDSPDSQPPEEDRTQGSQECAGTAKTQPSVAGRPSPADDPGPQLSSASDGALAGRLQHEDCHPPQTWGRRLCPQLHRQVPRWVPFSGTRRRKPLGPSRGAGRLAGGRSRPGAQTSGDLRPFHLLCPPRLHVSTAPGSVRRHAFLLPEAPPRLRVDYRLNPQVVPPGVRETSPAQSSTQHRVKRLVQVHGVPGSAGEAVRRGVSRGRVLSSQRPPVGRAKQPLQGSLHQVGNKEQRGKGSESGIVQRIHGRIRWREERAGPEGTASGESWRPRAHPEGAERDVCPGLGF
ncbi:collagen alpha-1(VII) chain-like [Mustela erminea]|uniref:collagen alpha-1(VII) chain-like n=1 Tax=Mustela erminea TaxID=36723 RepID=UPI001386D6CC|nr:collagen alpha-1(VII) chain-like [Mustela erminea]